jgi:membrane protease YdiL (CAAX protease family)
MPLTTPAFERYVDAARNGRTAFWRTAATTILTFALSTLVGMALLIVAVTLTIEGAFGRASAPRLTEGHLLLVGTLGILALLWPFLWLFLRLFQRRQLSTVLGIEGRVRMGDFGRGAVAQVLAALPLLAVSLAFTDVERSTIPLDVYLFWLAPLLPVILLQTSAEEVFFRGFLPQALAARFRAPLVFVVVPTALFAVLHYNGDLSGTENLLLMIWYVGFALLALLMVVRTGNLGAAMGLHFATNVLAILIVGDPRLGLQHALFWAPTFIDDVPGLRDLAAFLFAVSANVAIVGALLLHPRSPLRLRAPEPAPSPIAPDRS